MVILLCILLGLPGVGKTHLKFLLLNEQPPYLRTSTNCAEAPIRIEIRTITGTRLQTIRGRWKEVNDAEMFDVVAKMILVAESNIDIPPLEKEGIVFEPPKQSKSVITKIISWVKRSNSSSGADIHGAPALALSSHISATCKRATLVILDKVIQSITKFRGQDLSRERALCKKNSKN